MLWRWGRTKRMVRTSKGTGNHDVCKIHTCAISANIDATQKRIRHALECCAVIPSVGEQSEHNVANGMHNIEIQFIITVYCSFVSYCAIVNLSNSAATAYINIPASK